jgi:nicotinamide-nucleotide amidase
VRIEIVTIGNEILSGVIADGNFTRIARHLTREGLSACAGRVLPDDLQRMAAGLAAAAAESDALIVTGGLGGTSDDLTREAIARAFGRPLAPDAALRETLHERFRALGRVPDPQTDRMAHLPAGARALANRTGLAPGIHLRVGACDLFALPGVPAEMETMLHEEVMPRLLQAAGDPEARLATRVLRTTGLPETALAERVEPRLGPGVRVAYLPAAGRVDLRLAAASDPDGRAALESTHARLADELGPLVYARDERALEAVVLESFEERGWTLAIAESLTGGAIGEALTRVPGSSRVFSGDIVAYADAAKRELLGVPGETLAAHGAVSAQTAIAMAAGARRALRADVAVATTGIAGPGGGSPDKPVGLVYLGICDRAGGSGFRRLLSGDRRMIQERTTTLALNLLRLHALGRLDLAGSPALETREA